MAEGLVPTEPRRNRELWFPRVGHLAQMFRWKTLCYRPLFIRRRPGIAIGPTTFPRQGNRRFDPDLMPRCGAEFYHLEPTAEQFDAVGGLRALIAAVAKFGGGRCCSRPLFRLRHF